MRFEVIVKFVDDSTATMARVSDPVEANDLMIKALDYNLIKEAEVYDLWEEETLVYMTKNA